MADEEGSYGWWGRRGELVVANYGHIRSMASLIYDSESAQRDRAGVGIVWVRRGLDGGGHTK